jgi:hypothetical protein
MRLLYENDYGGYLFRIMGKSELAWVKLGMCGIQCEIEFPSDWHEERRGWICIGLVLLKVAISFPWYKTVPDDGQCSGPIFGFQFYDDLLFIRWGKDHGRRGDPHKALYMPWSWKHREHKILTEPETHLYTYVRKNGEIQNRTATIQVETRLWTRYWLPYRVFKRSIDVWFNDEVGERSGSWKGGTIGCSYEMLEGETPLQTLRRMEKERKF